MENEILNCECACDAVGYLYNEMADTDRLRFENHLADCGACIDEFAAMADARFGVYEWHKEEFVPLATPPIHIPDLHQKENWLAGLTGSVRAAFARPSGQALAFGVVLALIGITLFAWSYSGRVGDQVVSSLAVPVENAAEADIKPSVVPVISSVDGGDIVVTPLPRPERVPVVKASVALTRLVSHRSSPRKMTLPLLSTEARDRKNSPRLDGSSRDEDNSLRLADLFAEEVGTR